MIHSDMRISAAHKGYMSLPNVDQIVVRDAPAQSQVQSTQTLDYSPGEIICVSLLVAVIAVSIGLLIRGVLSHVRFALRLLSCRVLDDPPLINLLLHECD